MTNISKLPMYLGVFVLLALFVGGGYFVFRYFVTSVAGTFESYSLIFLAIIAGIATFFSPCSFPLLPSYLSLYLQTKSTSNKILYYGLAGALGIVLFNLILGSVIGLAGSSFVQSFSLTSPTPNPITQTIRIAIGSILVILGIAQFFNINIISRLFHKISHVIAKPGEEKTAKNIFLYGFGYTAAGLGCAGPITAGLVAFALVSGGLLSALTAFIIYSITMSVLMIIISLLVGTVGIRKLGRLQASAPRIKRIASIILILVGIFLIVSSIYIETFRRLFFP